MKNNEMFLSLKESFICWYGKMRLLYSVLLAISSFYDSILRL